MDQTQKAKKAVELAKKMKAMMDSLRASGEEEQAKNWEFNLQQTLFKYGLTIEDVMEVDLYECDFKWENKPASREILARVITMILGYEKTKLMRRGQKNTFVIECTNEEYLQIEFAYDLYWESFKKEQELFIKAFVSKNQLWADDAPKGKSNTNEEDLLKLSFMMQGIEKTNLNKQLKS